MDMMNQNETIQKIAEFYAKTPKLLPDTYKPNYKDNVVLALSYGVSCGFDLNNPLQIINSICFMHGRPCLWARSMRALLQTKGFKIEDRWDAKLQNAFCVITRPDGTKSEASFAVNDAKRAGLGGNVWSKYPQMMCTHRAFSWAASMAAADVLNGFHVAEDVQNDPVSYGNTQTENEHNRNKETADILAAYHDDSADNDFQDFCDFVDKAQDETALNHLVQQALSLGDDAKRRLHQKSKSLGLVFNRDNNEYHQGAALC